MLNSIHLPNKQLRAWLGWSLMHRASSWGLAMALGGLAYAPFVSTNLKNWQESSDLQDQIELEKMDLQRMQQEIEVLEVRIEALKKEQKLLTQQSLGRVISELKRLAHHAGLSVTNLSSVVYEPQSASYLKQQALSFDVRGTWSQWQKWSDQVHQTVPHVYLSHLKMTADRGQGAVIQLRFLVPFDDSTQAQIWQSIDADLGAKAQQEPLDAKGWQQTQRASHLRNRTPMDSPNGGQRQPHPLELVALQAIEYVGRLVKDEQVAAVLRVADAHPSERRIHILKVGDYLGKDMGQILEIKANELVLREVVLDQSGEWSTRIVKLPWVASVAF
jgi:Tfp pilus assembly protein PilP